MMINVECRMKDYPFDSECDKKWLISDNNGGWPSDQSISFICKNKDK